MVLSDPEAVLGWGPLPLPPQPLCTLVTCFPARDCESDLPRLSRVPMRARPP